MDAEKINKVIDRLKAEWADDPNVHTIWHGYKIANGELGEGPAICFGVRRKFDSEDDILAAKSRVIPDEVDGIPTDVYQVGGTDAYWSGSRGQVANSPLRGGGSTGPLSSLLPFPTKGGTLGGFCYYQDGREMALSNAHVWGYDLGCEIVQPVIPVNKLIGSALEVMVCGGIPAYIIEEAAPSALTVGLTAAAGAAWLIAAAADAKDPHRRGQEATIPATTTELTSKETVQFAAEPKSLPLPGLPYQAEVNWSYTRHTTTNNYSYDVSETQTNEHTLVRHHVWAEEPICHPGQKVKIMALVESQRKNRPDGYHVVVHLNPKSKPSRRVSCVLHPASVQEYPITGICLALGSANSPANFPIMKNGFAIQGSQPAHYRDLWPLNRPDGLIALQFADSGLDIQLPQAAAQVDLQVISLADSSLILEAFDQQGKLLETITTPARGKVQNLLKITQNGIRQLRLAGGSGNALLRWITMKADGSFQIVPLYPSNHIFTYKGFLNLAAGELKDTWRGLLSVQSVNTLPTSTPAIKAAASIGGVESAVLTMVKEPCNICLAMDNVFEVG